MTVSLKPTTAAGPPGTPEPAGLPPGWLARRIPAGVWVFEEPEPAPARAVELGWPVPDPARPIVVADGRGEPALRAAGAAVRSLVDQGAPRRVRLLLPGLSPQAAQRFADRHSVDVVATAGALRIGRSHLHTWGFNAERPTEFWQWFRFVPGRRPEPFGAIHPLPAWEASLLSRSALPAHLAGLVPYRIAAGLALLPGGPPDVRFLEYAAQIQPDPQRLTVVVGANNGEAAIVYAVESLFAALPAARRVRLVCPALARSAGVRELVRRYGAEVLAPDTEFTQTRETGALIATGPQGLGHWVRMTADGRTESLGPLHPVPSWRSALRAALFGQGARHGGSLNLAETPSGVRLNRTDGSSTARLAAAVPPDAERVTITADGDPHRPADRAAVEHLIGLLPGELRASFRLVMAHAEVGGPRAYGQWLANRFGALVGVASGVPAAAWEPTAPQIAAAVPTWQEFGPEQHPPFPPSRLLTDTPETPVPDRTPVGGPAASPPLIPAMRPPKTPAPATEYAGPTARTASPVERANRTPSAGVPVAGAAPDKPPMPLEVSSWRPARTPGTTPDTPPAGPPAPPVPDDVPVWPPPADRRSPRPTVNVPLPPMPDAGVKAAAPQDRPRTGRPSPANRPVPAAPPIPAPIPLLPPPVAPAVLSQAPAGPAVPPPSSERLPDAAAVRPGTSETASAASRPTLRRVPVRPLVPRGHRSASDERHRHRERLGARRERHMVAVSRVMTERPALRSAMAAESDDAVATDLAALRAYLSGDLPGLDAALRAGNAERADVACCVSGLRLLASYRGPAYRTADLTDDEAACYSPGDVLAEPAFTTANSRRPRPEGNALYAIWSRTARRVAPLAVGDDPGALLFAAGTAFTVLAAVRESDRWVVHLDERTHTGPDGALTDADRTVLARLREAGTEETGAAPRCHGAPLCVGDRCCYVPA
jgi:hypothetical protein